MKTIGLIALGLLVSLAIYLATRPSTIHYERSATIQTPPEAIFPYVNDLHRFGEWSPWEKVDPNMQRSYDGPNAGVGAGYHWKGNNEIGEGSMKITSSTPNREVLIALEFLAPFRASNVATFTLAPVAGGTKVTWAMDGPNPVMSRVMCLVMDMDKMIGGQFEQGLATLKEMVERGGK